MVRSEMEVVLRCENYVQVDALTVADFHNALCGLALISFYSLRGRRLKGSFIHFTVGVTRRLLLSSRVSLVVFTLSCYNRSFSLT